jgi:hypothetical protein
MTTAPVTENPITRKARDIAFSIVGHLPDAPSSGALNIAGLVL